VALGARDRVRGSAHDDVIVLGDDSDEGEGGDGRDVLIGGPGSDTLAGNSDADTLIGGAGDDVLSSGAHDDILVPGSGRDTTQAGSENDVVVIHDVCELSAGESHDGGTGTDTLITPVSVATLAALGVAVNGFERIVVDQSQRAESECGGCGCAVTGTQVVCCGGHGTCTEPAESGKRVCACGPGYTGDDCSIACPGGQPCDARIYRNGDGTAAGVALAGRVLFADTDAQASLTAWKAFAAAHEPLLGLGPMSALDLKELTFRETRTWAGLSLHRYQQRYRGLPIHGPGSDLTIVVAKNRGAISYMGTVVDPRLTYAGAEGALLCERWAGELMQAAWSKRFPRSAPALGPLQLVAVPSRRTLAYRANIFVSGVSAGAVLVSAAAADEGAVIGIFDGSQMFLAENSLQLRADNWALWPASATGDSQTSLFTEHRSAVSSVPILGNAVDPNACGGAPECTLLGDGALYLYDRNGLGVDSNLTGEYLVPLSPDGLLDASPGTTPYQNQNTYHKLRSAMHVGEVLGQCRWDWEPLWGMDACTAPTIISITNVTAPTFGGRFRGPETIGPLILSGGQLETDWTDRFFVPQTNAQGQAVPPSRLELNGGVGTTTAYHEFGHHMDWFAAHGIGGVVGDMMSLYTPGPGCPTPSTGCCRQNTSDEAAPLAETVADLWSLYFGRRLHTEVPQAAPLFLLGNTSTHSPNSSNAQLFATDRPRPNQTSASSGCSSQPGYKQRGLAQAFWELADGIDCGAASGLPISCAPVTSAVDPEGNPVAASDVMGQALRYALSKQPASGGWYQLMFDDMGEYVECVFGTQVFSELQAVFAHHGMNVFGPVGRQCGQICGDGGQDHPEQCDGDDLGGATCATLGPPFSGGTLACNAGCMFDTSGCFQCGNGVREEGEACDGADLGGASCEGETNGSSPFGSPACTPQCQIETSACETCEPGSASCRCLDTNNPGEANPFLPSGGIFGDGRYCLDDVSLGGETRCVDPPGAAPAVCTPCTVGQGVWCPCIPSDGCSLGDLEGPATGTVGQEVTCQFVCDPAFPDLCTDSPVGGHGYCFVQGAADPLAGGVPPWFFDQSCANLNLELVCAQQPGAARFCQMDPGPVCQP
jgi:Ca2+-binding RTX toxin-like protein